MSVLYLCRFLSWYGFVLSRRVLCGPVGLVLELSWVVSPCGVLSRLASWCLVFVCVCWCGVVWLQLVKYVFAFIFNRSTQDNKKVPVS